MIDFVARAFEQVEELVVNSSTTPWFFLFLFIVAFSDSVILVVPSDFAVIAGGVSAGNATLLDGRPVLSLLLVILFGSLGAYAGDTLAYWIGRGPGKVVKRIFFRGEKGNLRLQRASEQIRRRGGLLLVTARFIPGGRTATTFGCGLTKQPFLTWFCRWEVLATTLWAGYAAMLGYFVADRIENQSSALWLAFGLALSIALLVEIMRWFLSLSHRTS